MSLRTRGRGRIGVVAVLALSTALLAGCGGEESVPEPVESTDSVPVDPRVLIGTTERVTALDPAAAQDRASYAVQSQVFPYLLGVPYSSTTPVPDLAESAEFTDDDEYTVRLPAGLTWANGNALTSSDVKFSFERMLQIAAPGGPAHMLGNLDWIDAPDETTVVFHLKNSDDPLFPQVLASFPGAIVDEEVFAFDAVTPDQAIVDAGAFGGPYTISSWGDGTSIELAPHDGYRGLAGAPANEGVVISVHPDADGLTRALEEREVDVVFHGLSPAAISELQSRDGFQAIRADGGEVRSLVFDLATQPYGWSTDEAYRFGAQSVRQAVADVIDREAIAQQVYQGTATPLYSYVPVGLEGSFDVLMPRYGDGDGGPDVEQAARRLDEADLDIPVAIRLYFSPERYGQVAGEEFALIETQLEASGLFDVELVATDGSHGVVADEKPPVYQLGWGPVIPDADHYLRPLFLAENVLGNGYDYWGVNDLLREQARETDPVARVTQIEDVQKLLAEDLPVVPLLQLQQVAVAGTDVAGVLLDSSYRLRFATLTKGVLGE
ncbi:ABC transporter substrate-binding protein [Microbacterium sp. No. 7]|uniref:ABC transporter substrate-binding protein n=1 Tax=Microbacterium sp. No. 7 TaxID=1714373 RepID=UPI0006D1D94F|nr:ABC transporter substrate-binding protein [Microbacterium sp. No. 7]ALJ22290.1 hypothetical protein AOA12_21340 [Microbacterium sp. No. 7]